MTNFYSLPPEICDAIFIKVQRVDIIALSRTVQLTHALAIPHLYRTIAMSDYNRITLLLHTLVQDKRLCNMVLRLELHWQPQPAELLAKLAFQLCHILPKLSNLVHLTISEALGKSNWIYEHLNMPSLREFHAFTPVSARFLERHPHLRDVTIQNLDTQASTTGTANLTEPHFLRFLNCGSNNLLNICSDGKARRTLRRIDWRQPPHLHYGSMPTPLFDSEAIHRVASHVIQVNYLQGVSDMPYPLAPAWVSVKRVGIRVDRWSSWPLDSNPPARLFNNLAISFPNTDTLDVIIEPITGACSEKHEILDIWRQIQNNLAVFPRLMRVTLCGWNWTRSSPTAAFEETECDLKDIPNLSVDYP